MSDLNRKHTVTLTEGQMSTILYILEGYIDPTNDNSYDPDCREDIDRIFVELESVTDNYYAQLEEINELKAALNEGTKVWSTQHKLPPIT